LAVFLGLGALYTWRAAPLVRAPQRALFAAGWLVLAAAFLSPLCNLSVALFSARVGQHMLVTLVALPLLALGRAELMVAGGGRLAGLANRAAPSLRVPAWLGFTVALWLWHLPGPYDATLRDNLVYWSMHLSLIGTGLLLWTVLLNDIRHSPGAAFIESLTTTIQMALLGAVLTLAPRALFEVHAATTWPWGLSPLEDQQLGGVLMWVPGGMVFLAVSLWSVKQLLNGADRSQGQITSPA
jgi:putative membrane protein